MIALPDVLVPLSRTGIRPPLFCVHAISGSAYAYVGLARALRPHRPVFGFEAPGFDDDRRPVTSIRALAAEYVAALGSAGSTPERLLGWSMGGVVAFEMAQQLAAAGAAAPVVILVDSQVPDDVALTEAELPIRFLEDLAATAGLPPAALASPVASAGPDGLFAAVAAAGVLPDEIDAAFLQRRFGVFAAHAAALTAHRIEGSYRGRVVAIRASESPPELARWENHTKRLTKHVLPGDHYSIWRGEAFAELTRIVERAAR
jgi:thioesterase domain-containing protein